MFYDQNVWYWIPGSDKIPAELYICFTGGCSLFVLVLNNKDESTTKATASLEAVAQKTGYKGITDIIIDNLYLKLLLEPFGKSKSNIVMRVPLHKFLMFEHFNTQ